MYMIRPKDTLEVNQFMKSLALRESCLGWELLHSVCDTADEKI